MNWEYWHDLAMVIKRQLSASQKMGRHVLAQKHGCERHADALAFNLELMLNAPSADSRDKAERILQAHKKRKQWQNPVHIAELK